MFGLPPGVRKRMAMLNTSDEIRGLTLQEIRDVPVEFKSRPRAFMVLFETDDLLGIRQRARATSHRATHEFDAFQIVELITRRVTR